MTRKQAIALSLLAVLSAVVFALASCSPPYRKAWDDAASANHWTHKQELAAMSYGDRIFWAREVTEGSGQYVISYNKVPTAQIREQLQSVLVDFDQMLDPKNTDNRQYIEAFGLRKDLEHDEAITEAIQSRVVAADLDYQFKQDMGELPTSGPEAEAGAGYDIRKIFLAKDMATAFPFKSEVIEAAKQNGTLKEIEHATYSLDSTYDHKDADPNNMDDENDFVWKSSKMGIQLVNYKIVDVDKPLDNQGNYIEGYRTSDAGTETKPCLRIFFPANGSMAVVLIDTAREGEPGYGVPDILQQVSGVDNLSDVIRDGDLLKVLFAEKKTERRVIPPVNLFQIEISRLDKPNDLWETSTDPAGYAVPFKYTTGAGDNYNVRIKFKTIKADPSADPDEIVKAHTGYLDVDYIEKEYTKSGDRYSPSSGQVVEYYHPQDAFATQVRAEVLYNEDTKKVSFVYPDGTEVNGYVPVGANKFTELKPFAISYTEGQKRWYIEQHDSQVYNRRRLTAPPKERTGDYSGATSVTTTSPDQTSADSTDELMRASKGNHDSTH